MALCKNRKALNSEWPVTGHSDSLAEWNENIGMTGIAWQECLKTMADNAREADEKAIWPAASWQALSRAGVRSPRPTFRPRTARVRLSNHHFHSQPAGSCRPPHRRFGQRGGAPRVAWSLGPLRAICHGRFVAANDVAAASAAHADGPRGGRWLRPRW